MSEIELSTDILNWIGEESSHSVANNPGSAISIKLLILRLALKNRESQDTDLTQSTELSLQAYERASLFRTLMHLNKRGFVSFVSNAGKPLAPNEIVT